MGRGWQTVQEASLLTKPGRPYAFDQESEAFRVVSNRFPARTVHAGKLADAGETVALRFRPRRSSASRLPAARLNRAAQPRSREQGLRGAGYLNEHFKVSLHHLFFPNYKPTLICSYSIESEVLAEHSRCLSSSAPWFYTNFLSGDSLKSKAPARR